MSLMGNTVRRRLTLAFGLLIVLAAIQGMLSLRYLHGFSASVERMYNDDLLGIHGLDRARSQLDGIQFAVAEHIAAVDAPRMLEIADKIRAQKHAIVAWTEQVKSKEQPVVKRKLIATIDTNFSVYIAAIENTVLALSQQGLKAQAGAAATRIANDELRKVSNVLDDLGDYDANAAQTRGEYAAANYRTAALTLLTLIGLSLLSGIAVAIAVTRSVTRPLRDAAAIAHRVASGDLTSTIVVKSRDETGKLMSALKVMNENLVRIVGDVHRSTAAIGSAARDIGIGNRDLSQRTEEQASSLEQTAASMEQLTATVKQNAENSQQATTLAADTQTTALRGAELMGDMIRTMNLIDESAHKITQIIQLMDGIAFQTNILALNAAVEAARAGEQGRGFAVVASEVRSLALRSATSAREIKTLVDESLKTVSAGKNVVERAGTNMTEIVSGIKQVTEFIGEIATASLEQSSGLEQVNQAIVQLDDITQKNADLVQNANASATSLHEQARALDDAVRVFKLQAAVTATASDANKLADVGEFAAVMA